MSKKNSNVRSLKNAVKDNKKIQEIYLNFKTNLRKTIKNKRFIVAISGGPDSLSLAYFSKCYQLLNNKDVHYVHIDHKIRKNSTKEAKNLKYFIKKFQINCEILSWKKNKKIRATQENARIARYSLLEKFCKRKTKSN